VLRLLKLAATVASCAIIFCSFGAQAAEEYFRDNFSPESPDQKFFYEGTMEGKSFGYIQGGLYAIDATGSNNYGQSVLLHDLSSYEVEVRAQLKGNTAPKTINGVAVKAGWGITFNYTEDDGGAEHFLVALLNPVERNFSLMRVNGDKAEFLLGPMTAESVQAGANVLRVKADAGRITASINGIEVGSVFERDLLSGGFGLYVTPKTRGEFDYIAVYTEAVAKSLVEDDFNGQPARWFAGVQDAVAYAYEDGEYTIDATQGNKSGMSLFAGEHSAFELEVKARKITGPDNSGYGVFFQDVPNEKGGYDQFRFLVSNDGWFTVQRSFQDVPRALFQWAESNRIKTGEVADLRVRFLNGRLRFFINGYLVYELTDIPAVPGKMGLYVSSGVKAGFDDLKLSDF
jgi:hypothetical protein